MKILTTNLLVNVLDNYLFNKYNTRLGLNAHLVIGLQFIIVYTNNHQYTITYNNLIKYYVEDNRTNPL